jgi:hypothetical protein
MQKMLAARVIVTSLIIYCPNGIYVAVSFQVHALARYVLGV